MTMTFSCYMYSTGLPQLHKTKFIVFVSWTHFEFFAEFSIFLQYELETSEELQNPFKREKIHWIFKIFSIKKDVKEKYKQYIYITRLTKTYKITTFHEKIIE